MGPFATATEFCEFTGIALPTDLSRLQSQLQMASSLIRSFCNQTLSVVTGDVLVLDPVERDTLLLPERPVTAIASVVVDGVTLNPATDYNFVSWGALRSGTVILPGTDWSKGATVTYTHGYAETTQEFGVFRTLCIEVASRAFTMNKTQPGTLGTSEALGGMLMESAGYAPDLFLTTGEKMMLADYGKVLVG